MGLGLNVCGGDHARELELNPKEREAPFSEGRKIQGVNSKAERPWVLATQPPLGRRDGNDAVLKPEAVVVGEVNSPDKLSAW